MRHSMALALTGALMFALAGCAPQGRIMDEDEQSLVGAKSAGSATFNQLITKVTTKVLDQAAGQINADGKKQICFVGIDNKSAEELADSAASMYEQIDTMIVNSNLFTSVNKRFVDAVLRETGLRPDQLFLPKHRRTFMAELEQEGITPQYLLWGNFTSSSTRGAKAKEREYLLNMEMIDAKSGQTVGKHQDKVRKAYK